MKPHVLSRPEERLMAWAVSLTGYATRFSTDRCGHEVRDVAREAGRERALTQSRSDSFLVKPDPQLRAGVPPVLLRV
jgi:hypothetical protein